MSLLEQLSANLEQLKQDGLYKTEHPISSAQGAEISVDSEHHILNFCANNYLGLADHPILIETAQQALQDYGFGMASVRFICGTQTIHRQLEQCISNFLNTDDCILYSSCFDANGGLFETILGPEDAVISDALNHASIIDGIRLCKAKRFRYKNNDMADLKQQLIEADQQGAKTKLIATDSVFSMDGTMANLVEICELADQFNALVMVDDSHAFGFVGQQGRGVAEHYGVSDRIDIYTGTLGKALGGASGGFTAGRRSIIEWLRNRSRPYLFSNSLAPVIVATSLKVFAMLDSEGASWRQTLYENTDYFRQALQDLGFKIISGEHPIIPIMLGDAVLATQMADQLLQRGIYVVGFSYPVVPMGQARIRVQMSAAHTREHLDRALAAFAEVGRMFKVI